MQLEFLDEALRRLASESGHRPTGWGEAEIRHFLLVAQCAEAAQVATDLYSLLVLRLREHPADEPGTSSVQLSAQRRLTITFKTDSVPMTAMFGVLSAETEEPQ